MAAEQSLSWHLQRRSRASRGSLILNITATAFSVFAFVDPAVPAMVRLPEYYPLRNPLFFYLFIGGAVACIAIDKYMGVTASFARYTTIANELQRGLADFQMEWATMPKTDSGRDLLLERARRFRTFIEDIIRGETPRNTLETKISLPSG
jgi:hypothetical protein